MTGLLAVAIALAQYPDGAFVAEKPDQVELGVGAPPFGTPVTDEAQVVDRTMHLAHRLRCPVCQGLSVADSTSEASEGIKARVNELVRAGYTDDQITDYFVDRYGEWILLAPPAARHELLWILPWAGVVTAVGIVFWMLARAKPTAPSSPAAPTVVDDAYRRRVLEELGE